MKPTKQISVAKDDQLLTNLQRLELEEQRLMDELNKVDQVVGKIKDDYEKIRVDQIMGRTSNPGS